MNNKASEEEHFSLRFNSLFLNKEIGDLFENHLSTEFNTEPWKFLKLSETYKTLKTTDKIESEFIRIYDMFIENDSEMELNISGKLKRPVTQVYKKMKNNEFEGSLERIFEDISKSIADQLFFDSFPRFVRTKECIKFIEKHKKDSSLVTPIIISSFKYNDEYFKNYIIEDSDFDYFKILFQDNPKWDLISTKNGTNVFHSKFNYMPGVKEVKTRTMKCETVLPYSLEQAGLFIFNDKMIEEFDPNIKKVVVKDFIQTKELKEILKSMRYERNLLVMEYQMDFGFPFNSRIMKIGCSMMYIPEERMIQCVTKPYIDENESWSHPSKQTVDNNSNKSTKSFFMFAYSCIFLKEIDESKTSFTQIFNINLGGWMKNDSLEFIKTIGKERGKNLNKDMEKQMKAIPKGASIEDYKEKDVIENGQMKLFYETNFAKMKNDNIFKRKTRFRSGAKIE
eukprot:gene563-8073_t